MKATGIVRSIDDLGRVVIPKDLRRTMRIRSGSMGAAKRKMANSIFLQTEKYQIALIFFRLRLTFFRLGL